MSNFKLALPTIKGQQEIDLNLGQALFVLGANGVGKSSLMHRFNNQHSTRVKRITAHRQTWFRSNSLSITAAEKTQSEIQIRSNDSQPTSRYIDAYSDAKLNISIFELINSENIRARNIAKAVDAGDITTAQKQSLIQAPLQSLNELLAISNIPIKIILAKDEQLFASKNGGPTYSIAELSDGERNALLICADVLTAPPGSLIIIDEPERHLHRAIISPLLSSLFYKRKDCCFIISTHDVLLALDHLNANILLVRSCVWQGQNVQHWDVDLLLNGDEIPEQIKLDILGSKRNILFVEGDGKSLDQQIYQLIYPDMSVIPQGTCNQVEKSVLGIKGTEKLHWINAYGLVDADDRTEEQIDALYEKGIVALDCYSVEYLYYNTEIIKQISKRCADISGKDSEALNKAALSNIISDISKHKERMCARLCEKRVRNLFMSGLPKHSDIAKRGKYTNELDLGKIMNDEEAIFDKMVKESDIDGLLKRYPIRETPVLSNITKAVGLSKEDYESAVRKLIIDNIDAKSFYQTLLSRLSSLIIKPVKETVFL